MGAVLPPPKLGLRTRSLCLCLAKRNQVPYYAGTARTRREATFSVSSPLPKRLQLEYFNHFLPSS